MLAFHASDSGSNPDISTLFLISLNQSESA